MQLRQFKPGFMLAPSAIGSARRYGNQLLLFPKLAVEGCALWVFGTFLSAECSVNKVACFILSFNQ